MPKGIGLGVGRERDRGKKKKKPVLVVKPVKARFVSTKWSAVTTFLLLYVTSPFIPLGVAKAEQEAQGVIGD